MLSRWLPLPVRPVELRLLWPFLLLATAAWAFLEVAEEVLEGEANRVDMWVLALFRVAGQPDMPVGPAWFQEAMRDVTALGSTVVLTLTVIAVWGFLALAGQWRTAWFAALAAVGGSLLSQTLKWGFSRARPDEVYHATVVMGYSFPSGHAMMSTVVFLTLAALVARLLPSTRLRLYAVGVALVASGLVGVSRVYLGVHWASDVAAGWAAGTAWALLCWLGAERMRLGRRDHA